MKRRKPILSLIFLLILCVVLQSAAFARRLTFIQCGFLFAGASGRVGYRGIRSGELFRLYAEWRTCHRFRCGKRCARLSNGPSRAEYGIPPFGGDLRRGRPRRRGVCLSVDNYTLGRLLCRQRRTYRQL